MFSNTPIHKIFLERAAQTPDQIALVCGDQERTYDQVAQQATRLAHALKEQGVSKGSIVGLFVERSPDAIVAILGVLMAGAAYLPFDSSYPANLLKQIYKDSSPSLMIVQGTMLAGGTEQFWEGDSLDLDADLLTHSPSSNESTLPLVSGTDLAYVMFTSGSTGRPKGVLVPHQAVVRLVIDNDFVELGPDEVILQLAPLSFDASTFEIWGALLNGGKLAIQPIPHPSLSEIAESIVRHGVTTAWLTAGLFHLMIDHKLDGLLPLRQLLAGGDVLSPQHVFKASQRLRGCKLINGYGPTENTTFTCCYTIPATHDPNTPIPIGKPIKHTDIFVLDANGKQVSDGEEGELFVGGIGLALGYLNRPELTAEKFVQNPFGTGADSKLYRTGDLVRRRTDGNVEFFGRVDRQVKISGKRVELDEIEACFRRSGLVQDCAVVVLTAAETQKRIAAFVTSADGNKINLDALRSFLKQELPDYMVPGPITELDTLPLSPTGKVDRAKLTAEMAVTHDAPDTAGLSQPGSIESELLKIWSQVLGAGAISVNDNFFDLGGTSLQLIQIHEMIQKTLKADLKVLDLFQYPRISALAAWMTAQTPTQNPVRMTAQDRARKQAATLGRLRSSIGKGQR